MNWYFSIYVKGLPGHEGYSWDDVITRSSGNLEYDNIIEIILLFQFQR